MSKIRYFKWGGYEYFEHCPFCGSVAVDFDKETFRCPDCGAVVTFDLPERESICDGPSDADKMVRLWNNRKGEDITADDLCVIAQKAEKELIYSYQSYIQGEVWSYVVKSATIGKYECEIPKALASPDFYREKKFDVTEKENSFIVSWKKDIKWDSE